ncbi:hypothetical protein PVAND_015620 [Polypedilum vanderplanki]|uniref:F-box domain-containing protein n=1 Tax=Polypedilum vanderplanki TaxID=319348 RepID=A0A9J6BDM8_POLVA|nr:hypothetical protein PVAND_015620 [Polypedilum vanderplanki]
MGYVPTDYDKYFEFNLVDFSNFDINIEPPTPPPLPPNNHQNNENQSNVNQNNNEEINANNNESDVINVEENLSNLNQDSSENTENTKIELNLNECEEEREKSAEIEINFNFDIVSYDLKDTKMNEKVNKEISNESTMENQKIDEKDMKIVSHSVNEENEVKIEQKQTNTKTLDFKDLKNLSIDEDGIDFTKYMQSETLTVEENFENEEILLLMDENSNQEIKTLEISQNNVIKDENYSDFDIIPMELIVHIFKFLNPSDLKCAALVSRRFLSACTYKKLNSKFMLHFVDSFYKQFAVSVAHFSDTFRPFPAISLSTGNFDYSSQSFWWDYGLNVEEIYFRNGILRKQEFEDIIRWTPKLKILKIESNSIFTTWKIRNDYSERILKFDNCYHISLSRNGVINRSIFDYVVFKAPNLRELDLSYCLARMNPRDKMAILDHLIFYLKGYGESIKLLNLAHTPTDDFFLQQLSEVNKLKLKSLSLTFNGCVTNSKFGLIPLLRKQDEIEDLNLSESPAVEEIILMEICTNLKNLKRLYLKKCSHVTDYSLVPVSKCENLVTLDISSCDLVTDEGIYNSLMVGTPKKNLKQIYFALLSNITEAMFVRLGTKFHEQITHLDLGGSTNLADDALQTIFNHFTKIRFLNLDSCCKISDYGITGKFQNQVYFSIKNLQGLRTFRMQNCYKLTDFSLIDAFQFIELRELFMARTHFSREGIEAMVKNCPAIEILDLGEVNGVDDDCVEIIVKNLQRLHTLKLNGNEKISAKIFDHIYKHCEVIKYLYLRNCPNLVTDKLNDQLYLMRSLRKVYLE